jgi:hypothetical protein
LPPGQLGDLSAKTGIKANTPYTPTAMLRNAAMATGVNIDAANIAKQPPIFAGSSRICARSWRSFRNEEPAAVLPPLSSRGRV